MDSSEKPDGHVPPTQRLSDDEDGDLAVMLSYGFYANLGVVAQVGEEFH